MNPPDHEPTTSFSLGQPGVAPTPYDDGRLGRRGRITAIVIAVIVLIAAVAGIGMAFGDLVDNDSVMMPNANAQGPHDVAKHNNRGDRTAREGWAHQYGRDRSAMPNLPDVASASSQQQAAAADLLSRTEAATAPYADAAKAQAAGFDLQASLVRAEQLKPGLAQRIQRVDDGAALRRMPMLHVVNKENLRDGRVLDPSAPETLMYEYEGHNSWKLVGVMYVANEAFPQAPPDPGGPITRWHYHDINGGASLMMHIFFVPGNDLARAYALTMEGM